MISPIKNDYDEYEEILVNADDNIINKESQNDDKVIKLQENLLMMGFDINMVNKVILYFNIKTEDEAIDYLVKTEEGMWNHPFIDSSIEKESIQDQNEDALNKSIIDNVITKVKSLNNDFKIGDVCVICGEKKEFHRVNNGDNFVFDDDLINNNELNNSIYEINFKNDVKENENENDNICKICLDQAENPVEIEKCKHKFCHSCLESYLNNLINENNIDNIPCPDKNCNNKSLSINFIYQNISEQQQIKYQTFKTKNEISRNKLTIFCPICDSYAKIDNPENYNPNNLSYIKKSLFCQKGHKFCSCGRPEHDGECYHDGEDFKNLIIKEKIKKCPKCGFLIKKNSGCNHMTCGNKACKFEFCWLCLQESLPDHYESGPCYGKQFIDPDNIFYQLEQKYPFLFYVFFAFKLFILLLIICSFLFIPVLPLWIFTGYLLYDNFYAPEDDEDKIYTLSKALSIWHFVICIPVLFSVQSIFYMILGFGIVFLVFYILNIIFSAICKIFLSP